MPGFTMLPTTRLNAQALHFGPRKPFVPPLLRLPTELLREILGLTIVAPFGEYDSGIPLILSQICSRLRAVAMDTGPLWSTIILSLPLDSESLIRMNTNLERSKGYPLDVILDLHDPEWEFDEDYPPFNSSLMKPITKILIKHAHRWRNLALWTDTWCPIHTFLKETLSVTSLPQLQRLELTRCNGFLAGRGMEFYPSELQEPIPLFNSALMPRLQQLELSGVHFDWTVPSLRGLTSLQFKYHSSDVMPDLSTFVNILSACPDLENLCIMGWGPIIDTELPPHSIVLPHVQSFSFGFLDTDYALQLLRLFSFPSLLHFTVENVSTTMSFYDTVEGSEIIQFLLEQQREHQLGSSDNRSPIPLSQITSFVIDGVEASQDLIRDLFMEMESLEQLGLVRMSNDTLRTLEPYGKTHTSSKKIQICPSLREIACRGVEVRLIAQIVELRKEYQDGKLEDPLELVTCANLYHPPESDDMLDRVSEVLRGVGVDFDLREAWNIDFNP